MANPEEVVAVALAKKTTKTIKKKTTLSRTKKAAKKSKSPKKKSPKKAKSPKKKGKKKATKKKAKKTKKKKKKKKAKKKKRKKAKKKKKTRKEGGNKSAKSKAAGRKKALAQKAKGVGLFAPKTLSKELAAICGGNKMARPQVVKKVWAYIKSRKLNKGRTINPDATLKAIVPSSCSMFKLMGYLNKHIK